MLSIRSVKLCLIGLLVLGINASLIAQETAPPTPAPAEIPPVRSERLQELYRQAQESGISDTELKKAAEQQGVSVEDLLRAPESREVKDRNETDPARKQLELEEDLQKFIEEDSIGSHYVSLSGRGLSVFGANFFSRPSNTFEPNLRIPTPKNYILGPDDELIVDIYGNAVDNFKLKVSPEGTVKIYNLEPLIVNGLTVEQATERIIGRLRQAYSRLNMPGGGTSATITLGSIRSIKIMVTGEAVHPGTYTVSSLATAFNVLVASGGPNANGSFRDIQVIRDNKVIKTIDLYRFLVQGDLNDNIALYDQDIILIRPYSSRIEFTGEVKRPGIFELREGETFKDLLSYAGGFTPKAFTHHFIYRRNNGIQFELGSFLFSELETFKPVNGDQIRVDRIVESVSNIINVSGAVSRPGIYPFEEKNNTLKKVLKSSLGLAKDAFLGRANILRITGYKNQIVSFNLGELLHNEDEDMILEPGDIIIIKSLAEINQAATVSIGGEINRPGSFIFHEKMTIPDLIYNAGGFTRGGVPYRIEVSRRIKYDTTGIPSDQNVRIFQIDVAEDLVFHENDGKFTLEPFDRVYVRQSPRYEIQKTVRITGEVKFPGTYTIRSNFERISDLIPKAGGLKPGAYLDGVRLIRGGELVALDIARILSEPEHPSNILLKDGDELTIPTKVDVVRIQGGVMNPSLVYYQDKFSYKDYIAQAGGYHQYARKRKAYVSYPNGRTDLIRRGAKIVPGSTITVPARDPEKVDKLSRSEIMMLITFFLTTTVTINRLF